MQFGHSTIRVLRGRMVVVLHNYHPARRLRPLDSRNARRCASRIPKAKGMKGRKGTKGGGRYAANILISLRVTGEEKTRLVEQAEIAGLSLSEYMRRRFFGGRIAAYTDLTTIAELRRIGGLLKHNFETLRQAKAPPDVFERQEDALRNLIWAIQKISLRCHHDCQENQEHEN